MTFRKQQRLPLEPLFKMFNGEISKSSLADVIKVRRETIHNWETGGGIPEDQADAVAVRLGLHPCSIWGDEWWKLAVDA